jgi:hypothetical protein
VKFALTAPQCVVLPDLDGRRVEQAVALDALAGEGAERDDDVLAGGLEVALGAEANDV